MPQCPRCASEVDKLNPISPDEMMKLDAAGEKAVTQLCSNCYAEISSPAASGGSVLMAQEKAKEQHRLLLWKSRVNLIKKARSLMGARMYAEAAVSYEKYLKILELVFKLKKGSTLTPEHFKDTARTTELTVVASVYWDLLRIYDSHQKYYERQQQAARQLAIFIRFTPIFPDIIKRAESFVKNAKNPAVIRSFLKNAVDQRPRCFIATAAFEDPFSIEVVHLRIFRDFILEEYFLGRIFISFYYFVSPRLASFIEKDEGLKAFTRFVLRRLIQILK
ncbi:MAG: CFI-box-CTERM domain-containing protein [Bdellovibrionota bacterium]